MSDPRYRGGVRTTGIRGDSNIVVNAPPGVQQNDLVFVSVMVEVGGAGTQVVTAPGPAWTAVIDRLVGANVRFTVFWKLADASEPDTYKFVFTTGANSQRSEATAVAFYDVNTADPVGFHSATHTSNPPNKRIYAGDDPPPYFTTTVAGLLVGLFGLYADAGITAPDGYQGRITPATGRLRTMVATDMQDAAGDVGPVFALADVLAPMVGGLVVVKPDQTAPPSPPGGQIARVARVSAVLPAVATSIVVPRPSAPNAVAAGDVMIAQVVVRDGYNDGTNWVSGAIGNGTDVNGYVVPPTGWTAIGRTRDARLYYKVASASEPTTYTWNFAQGTQPTGAWAPGYWASAEIVAYRGVHNGAPVLMGNGKIVQQAVQRGSGAVWEVQAPPLKPNINDCMVVAFFARMPQGSFSQQPSGYSIISNVDAPGSTGAMDLLQADLLQGTAQNTGPLVAIATDNTLAIGQTLILLPASATPPVGGVPPAVDTDPAVNVTNTGAQLVGFVNPNGRATTWNFEYGIDASYGTQTPNTSAGTGTTTIQETSQIAGLVPGQQYHYRITATNSAGTSYGDDEIFTPAYIPPPPQGTPGRMDRGFWLRDDGVTHPAVGNYFMQLFRAPLISIPEAIAVGPTTYYKDQDYWLIHEVTSAFGSRRARDGIEWNAANSPLDGVPVVVEYFFNSLVEKLDEQVNLVRLVGTDTLVHRARYVYLRFNLAIMLQQNASLEVVASDIETALTTWLGGKGFKDSVQFADMIDVVSGVNGVDNVRMLQQSESQSEVQTITITGATGGTFSLSHYGETTGSMAWNSSASQVRLALENLPNMVAGDVAVTSPVAGTYVITFQGVNWGNREVEMLTINDALTPDGVADINVVETVKGAGYGIESFAENGRTLLTRYLGDFYLNSDQIPVVLDAVVKLKAINTF